MKIGNANVYRRMILAFLPLVQQMGAGHTEKWINLKFLFFLCKIKILLVASYA